MPTFEGLLKAFGETGGQMVSANIDGWEFILGLSTRGDLCLRATPATLLASTDTIDRARDELRIPPDASVHRFPGGRIEILWSGDWPVSEEVTRPGDRRRLPTLPDEVDAGQESPKESPQASPQARSIVDRVLVLDQELRRAEAMNKGWLRLFRARRACDQFDELPEGERRIEDHDRLVVEYNAACEWLESMGVDLDTDDG